MTFITDTPAAAPSMSILAGMMAAFGNFRAAQEAAWDYNRLSAMSDAALAAQGIVREDLPRIVVERHFR